ncbi:Ca-activated chloride channel family protein [Sinorhizobium kostiense]|uniref:Ca-activated chloride channel family protein n=1 Tax=Sinorhizobium kostiense TaxID=76747 RepID=A0ABS4R5Y6_9HYPH|nr:VWA domain-containing protein [Sinorhizobium kostiense]MBP2238310.1 Ca-activated chloride channel family protein [Sinorhizobium kostiense]
MTDEFNALSGPMPPKPKHEARARAFAAAMQAYDEAAKKSGAAAQGWALAGRRSSIINRIWSPIMNRKLLAGSALATLIVVPAAAFLTLEMVRNNPSQEAEVQVATRPVPSLVQKPASPATIEERALTDQSKREASPVGKPAPAAAENDEAASQAADAAAPMSSVGGAADLARGRLEIMPAPIAPADILPPPMEDRERFGNADASPVKSVATEPVSTFSVDVDTASYAFVRRSLMAGEMPNPDAVRVEEMINYFPYDWPRPASAAEPFKATVTLTPAPWNAGTRLMHVAIKGYDVVPSEAPKANLVFLIDVSGSMDEPDKLPLLKNAFRLLIDRLKPEDTVSIVTYAGNAGTVLEPTAVKDKAKILSAIDTLQPGGSTAGAAGIDAAYVLAEKSFVKDGVNRILLATDGDFNVGPASDEELKRLIEEKRKSGIFLSALGFGRGNYNDALMQTIAQNGNGVAAYIDTLAEAQKALVEEAGSSLFPIAKDVKLQVEFNPAAIAEYRLIGYETRALKREDFNNDKVDAGDIGSGHSVTAIYELTPKGSPAVLNDDLRYATAEKRPVDAGASSGELAFLKIRYKKPDGDKSELIATPVTEANAVPSLAQAPADVRFSVAVAAFGQKLAGISALADYSFTAVIDLAAGARGADPFGYRGEFVNLVRLAKTLSGG